MTSTFDALCFASRRAYVITVFTPLQLVHVVKWLPAFFSGHPSVRTVLVDGVISHCPGAAAYAGYTPFVLCDEAGKAAEKAEEELDAEVDREERDGQHNAHGVSSGTCSPKELTSLAESESALGLGPTQRQGAVLHSTATPVAAAASFLPGSPAAFGLSSTEFLDACRLPLPGRLPPPPSAAQLLTSAVQHLLQLQQKEKFLLVYTKQLASVSPNSPKPSGLASVELSFPLRWPRSPLSFHKTAQDSRSGETCAFPLMIARDCLQYIAKGNKRKNRVLRLQEGQGRSVPGSTEEGGKDRFFLDTNSHRSAPLRKAEAPSDCECSSKALGSCPSTSRRQRSWKESDRVCMVARFEGLPPNAAAALRLASEKGWAGLPAGPRGKVEDLFPECCSSNKVLGFSGAAKGSPVREESFTYSCPSPDHAPRSCRPAPREEGSWRWSQGRRFSNSRVFRLQLIPAVEALVVDGCLGEKESGSQAAAVGGASAARCLGQRDELTGVRSTRLEGTGSRATPFLGSVVACVCTYAATEELGRSRAVAGAAVWKGDKEGVIRSIKDVICGAVGGRHVVLGSGEGATGVADQAESSLGGRELRDPALSSKLGVSFCSEAEAFQRSRKRWGSGEGREEGVKGDREECISGDGGGGHLKTVPYCVPYKSTHGVGGSVMCCVCCALVKRGGADVAVPL